MSRRIIAKGIGPTKGETKETLSSETLLRGLSVLNNPILNKGTAFTREERKALGLTGLLPPDITTLETQVKQAYIQYGALPDALSKNIYLTALHDRNEVLFFRLFSEHLREMIPIVNDLTVGVAMEHYHHECRRPRGVYLSIDHPAEMDESFDNLGVGAEDVDLILATDAEQILGIGDWGIGGIEVSIGKLAIYTAAGGIDPGRVIPVMLDVGTNRESLLNDPLYIGNRHARIRGERYDAFIDQYVSTVTRRFPNALLQWEDLAPANGRRILDRYRSRVCTFNDDMEGTGAITLSALISAMRVCASPFRAHRVVIFGAGTAGIGIADQISSRMVIEGLSEAEARKHFWCVDRQGLLTADMEGTLSPYQSAYARPMSEVKGWKREAEGMAISLAEVVRRVKPTMLVGSAAAAGAFTEAIVREMASHVERPVIFVLSKPAARAEAIPSDLIQWTKGRGLLATGSEFPPVTYQGLTYAIAQLNNAMLYPGLALGIIASRASGISEGMFAAAANSVSSLVTVQQIGASLLPHIDDLRSVSLTVALAVAEAAEAEGVARQKLKDLPQSIEDLMWKPEYSQIRATS